MTERTQNMSSKTSSRPELTQTRKPRLIIGGEFSAGKTRLITGLVKDNVLPSNVTATALPPVWLVSGRKHLAAVDLNGEVRELETLDGISVTETHYCVVSHPAEILTYFDIIDTPGSSDPGIPAESWERMMDFADMAVWCTNATQAWRQSEKSVWDELPEHLVGPAMLLVTHADRMADDKMAQRVLRRVRREAGKYFSHFEMASLIKSADVERISDMLETIFDENTSLMGCENPVLQELITRWEAEPAPLDTEVTPALRVIPKRVVKSKSETSEAEDALALAVKQAMAADNVLMLNTESIPPVKEVSLVRAAWNEMSETLDFEDPKAILDCIERFVSLLERNGPLYLADSDSQTAIDDQNDVTKPALENGRLT